MIKVTQKMKENLKEARTILEERGWVQYGGVMHSGSKTKYSYGSFFINTEDGKKIVLNIETSLDILNFDFVQVGINA